MVPLYGGQVSGFGNVMGQVEEQYQEARAANERRYAQAMAIYDEIIKRYQPGGGFGEAALGQLEKRKGREVATRTQSLISSGLYGTTGMAALGTQWEEEVGAPARLRLEDIMMERLSQAQLGKAGFIERREDVYPDVGAAAGYAAQFGAAGGGRGTTVSGVTGETQRWGTYGAGTPSGAGAGVGAGGGRTTSPGPGVASATIHVGPPHALPTPGYGLADQAAGLTYKRRPLLGKSGQPTGEFVFRGP